MRFASIILLSLGMLCLFGCKKENHFGDISSTQTGLLSYNSDVYFAENYDLSPQQRVLLLEEFTGVYCYTCPLAHGITADIIQTFPNQVAAINIHSHLFSIYDDPNVMGNLYDFRTADGDTIVNMLGGVLSVPSAAFNRTLQVGENEITSNKRNAWMNYALYELNSPPEINIDIATSFDSISRNLKIVVKYKALTNFPEDVYHTVTITENDIIDKQFVDTAEVPNYHHMHILRDVITDVKGDLLFSTQNQNNVGIKVFNYTVPVEWNEANLKVVSFAHQKNTHWDVYQAAIK